MYLTSSLRLWTKCACCGTCDASTVMLPVHKPKRANFVFQVWLFRVRICTNISILKDILGDFWMTLSQIKCKPQWKQNGFHRWKREDSIHTHQKRCPQSGGEPWTSSYPQTKISDFDPKMLISRSEDSLFKGTGTTSAIKDPTLYSKYKKLTQIDHDLGTPLSA